ncbi:MAG TPA: hypothetical protein PLB55_03630 [Prosthecobacter sp.]|nr:hypothetical protein [Prosthecobacter sp.]
MDAISPMLQFCIGSRFARTATFDGGVKNQEGDAVAAGSAVPNTSDGGAGACSGDAGTGSAGNFTGGFIIGTGSGRSFTGSSGAGEGSIGVFTGSGLPITDSHAGGEVPLLLSRVPVMAEPVPVSVSQVPASFPPIPVLPGRWNLYRGHSCPQHGPGMARVPNSEPDFCPRKARIITAFSQAPTANREQRTLNSEPETLNF